MCMLAGSWEILKCIPDLLSERREFDFLFAQSPMRQCSQVCFLTQESAIK